MSTKRTFEKKYPGGYSIYAWKAIWRDAPHVSIQWRKKNKPEHQPFRIEADVAASVLRELSEFADEQGAATIPDQHRVWFLRGVLAAVASNRQTITYDEVRRLCRFNDEQLPWYLDAARKPLQASDQPDFCALVVKTSGKAGVGWGDPDASPSEALRAHQYWQERRLLDNVEFEARHGALPALPGLENPDDAE